MVNTSVQFADSSNADQLFASEYLIRKNRVAFRSYCYEILQQRQLPLSHIALTFYLQLVEETDEEIRKDKITPREQHEQSHLITMDRLLDVVGSDWIDKEKFGSTDALFAAIILHDVIEDLKISESAIEKFLLDALNKLHKNGLSEGDYLNAKADLGHTLVIVTALSRKDAYGKNIDANDRIAQANRWLEHPYAYLIKMIDWSNKLQTMIGVDHFEDNDWHKMRKVIDETGLLFVDQQQAMTAQATNAYPQMEKAYSSMEGIMGMLFQTLNTYRKLQSGELTFDPEKANPFNFEGYWQQSGKFITSLPRGNNYIEPMIERIDVKSQDNPSVKRFLKHMVKPAFYDSDDINPSSKLTFKPQ